MPPATKNIVLTGFMATGKSVVGAKLAARLKRTFVDLDGVIEAREGVQIHEIFERSGETHFRRVEKEALREALRRQGQVIATGGGAIVDEENLRAVKESSLLICLTASPQTVLRRTASGDPRPLLSGENKEKRIEELMGQRQRSYNQAHLIVETDSLSVDQVVETILRYLGPKTGRRS